MGAEREQFALDSQNKTTEIASLTAKVSKLTEENAALSDRIHHLSTNSTSNSNAIHKHNENSHNSAISNSTKISENSSEIALRAENEALKIENKRRVLEIESFKMDLKNAEKFKKEEMQMQFDSKLKAEIEGLKAKHEASVKEEMERMKVVFEQKLSEEVQQMNFAKVRAEEESEKAGKSSQKGNGKTVETDLANLRQENFELREQVKSLEEKSASLTSYLPPSFLSSVDLPLSSVSFAHV